MSIYRLALTALLITSGHANATSAAQPVPVHNALHSDASFAELLQPPSIASWVHSGPDSTRMTAKTPDTEHPSSLLLAGLAAVGFVARRRQSGS